MSHDPLNDRRPIRVQGAECTWMGQRVEEMDRETLICFIGQLNWQVAHIQQTHEQLMQTLEYTLTAAKGRVGG